MTTSEADRERFAQLFHDAAPRVRAYARRHLPAAEVDEVVADVFLVAWRRRDALPSDDPVPWLLVTTRQLIANRRRRLSRTEVSGVDLEAIAGAGTPADATAGDRAAALTALAELTDREREAVLLVAWDGLNHRAAARVAGCSARAFTVRLHRARLRLARSLDDTDDPVVDPPASRHPFVTTVQELS